MADAVTLQSAIEAELPYLRAEANATFTDTFTAESLDLTKVDGLDVEGWVFEYETPGKIAGPSSQSRDTDTSTVTIGGVERDVVKGGLHIPLTATLPTVGMEFECTAVGPTSDPSLVGRRWRVIDVPAKSFATARRLDVVEVAVAEED